MSRYIVMLFLLFIIDVLVAQNIDYAKFQRFDTSGVFQGKIIIQLDSIKSSRVLLKDSLTIKKLNYLHRLLEADEKLVIMALLYNDSVKRPSYGADLVRSKAKSTYRYLMRKGVYPLRIQYKSTSFSSDGFINEELISENRRVEFLIYELPNN